MLENKWAETKQKLLIQKIFQEKTQNRPSNVFACLANVKNMNAVKTGKFGPKAQKCVLLVYAYNRTAYLVQKLETRRIIETKNFKFNEKNLPGLEKKLRKKTKWRLFSDGFRPNRKK